VFFSSSFKHNGQASGNRDGFAERGGTWKNVLMNKPHYSRPDASEHHAARLETADVPKDILVALPEGLTRAFTLDMAHAYLADYPDLKAPSRAVSAGHIAALRIVSAIGVSPPFS
jgi:hypothetical protein